MVVDTLAATINRASSAGVLRFHDSASGCDFIATTPEVSPGLWHRYMQGALDAYRHYGVESALEYDAVIDGKSTALFFMGTNHTGAAVAGIRFQGPYTQVGQVSQLFPWSGRPGDAELRAMCGRRLRSGVVESRAGWVSRKAPQRRQLAYAMSRCVSHGLHILGVRYDFATVASFTTDTHEATGGVVVAAAPAVNYPDDRYQTVAMWWDRVTAGSLANPMQGRLMYAELSALKASACVESQADV